jgi:hypothetical protein
MEQHQEICYQHEVAPDNIKQNCALWEYDNRDGVYLNSITMRKIIYYATPAITYGIAYYFNGWMASRDIGQSFLGSVTSFALQTITPFVAFKSQIFLELNDAMYSLFARDEVLEDTKLYNDILYKLEQSIKENHTINTAGGHSEQDADSL